jgi:glutamate:Na+ symporter, ESS family
MNSITQLFFSICLLSIFILTGKFLRTRVKVLQNLFLPSSIIAGFVGMLFGPYILNIIPMWIIDWWRQMPGILISVVFATLFLGVKLPKPKQVWRETGPMLSFGMIMGFGQYFVAILVVALILGPFFGVPNIFACILEIGFSGGHGTAAGMKVVFDNLGYPAGGALCMMSATVGIVYAVVMGIVLINIAIRKNQCAEFRKNANGIPQYKKIGLVPKEKRSPIGIETVATESIDPLTFHFIVIAVSIMVGWIMMYFVRMGNTILNSLPLFLFAMIGGFFVQVFSNKTNITKYYDKSTFDRLTGLSLDILVASAIATLKLDLFLQNLWPFSILMVAGMAWLFFMVYYMAPRMFPKFWFERSITEFGMQAGVTAIGLMLLRLVDPEYKTGTAEAFGMKLMIYVPFLGGGALTVLFPLIITYAGMWWSLLLCTVAMLIFFAASVLSGWTSFNFFKLKR